MPVRKTKTTAKTQETKTVKTSTSPIRKIKLKSLILPVVIVIIVVLLGIFRGEFVVATVNDQQISRIELIKELEKQYGSTVLENLITQELIKQEAKKKNITVSEEDIDKELQKIEKSVTDQGQNLDLLLAQQNLTREGLRDQLKTQITLQKMVGEIKVSDAEIDQYIKDNASLFQEGTNTDDLKPQIKQSIEQQKLTEKVQALVQDLQQKAKIERLKNF